MSTEQEKNIVQNAESPTETEGVPESINDILAGVDPKKIEMAEKLGIPIGALFKYLQRSEATQKAIIQNLPNPEAIQKISNFVDQVTAAQQQAQNQPNVSAAGNPSGGLMSLLPLIGQIMGGGGGMSDWQQEYLKKMMDMQFVRLTQDVSFTRTMENYVKSKMASKMAGALTDEL